VSAAPRPIARGSHTVDIADFAVSDDPNATLVTYSLGSCIGVTIWDPQKRVGGMIHYMLPEASINPEKAKAIPAMFAETGVPLLFRSAYALGAVKSRLIVKVAGGAQLLGDSQLFDIGKRNYLMLRKLLWKNGVLIEKEDVGGSLSRTIRLEIGSGRFSMRRGGEEVEL
jgi:chemotaxis protein CheD